MCTLEAQNLKNYCIDISLQVHYNSPQSRISRRINGKLKRLSLNGLSAAKHGCIGMCPIYMDVLAGLFIVHR